MSLILVTGGVGYVGSQLVPELLREGHDVRILSLSQYLRYNELFKRDARCTTEQWDRLSCHIGDIRDHAWVKSSMADVEAVVHLACVANDDAFAMDPKIGKETNYDAFRPLVRAAKDAGVRRFIYASSSSVYGVKTEAEVTEDLPLEPLTDYSKYKGLCEDVLTEERDGYVGTYGRHKAEGERILNEESAPGFVTATVRPGTLCGWAPGLRLDLICNMFVAQAMTNDVITVWGGDQHRALLDVRDMTRLYRLLLTSDDALIDRKVWNIARGNYTARNIAAKVAAQTGAKILFEPLPPNDQRSYQISSQKIADDLGFVPSYTIDEAIDSLVTAFRQGLVPDALTATRYYRLRRMKELLASGELV